MGSWSGAKDPRKLQQPVPARSPSVRLPKVRWEVELEIQVPSELNLH